MAEKRTTRRSKILTPYISVKIANRLLCIPVTEYTYFLLSVYYKVPLRDVHGLESGGCGKLKGGTQAFLCIWALRDSLVLTCSGWYDRKIRNTRTQTTRSPLVAVTKRIPSSTATVNSVAAAASKACGVMQAHSSSNRQHSKNEKEQKKTLNGIYTPRFQTVCSWFLLL